MSDRWVPRSNSRWSSERDRARRTQRDRQAPQQPASEETSGPPRQDPEPPAGSEERSSTERIDRLTGDLSTSGQRPRRSRARRGETSPETGDGDSGDLPPALPDLPGSSSSGGSGGNRIIILGALLFLAMAAIAILPRLLDDDDSDDPTPTPEMIQTPTPPGEQAMGGTPEEPSQSVQDAEYVVCIDAGHGGWDTGRVRESNSRAPSILEKEINLGMAWMLKERLEADGIGVVLTRPSGLAVNVFNEDVNGDGQTLQDSEQAGDRDELQARINICNEAEADLLLSLHLNGFDDPSARGYEVLYTPAPFREFGDRNADLATYIYREISAAYNDAGFETTPRGTIPDTELDAEMHAFGVERHLIMTGPAINNADFTLVPSAMPGVVIEPVFITNDDDAAFIARPENQRLLVDAYADGVLTYFDTYPDGP